MYRVTSPLRPCTGRYNRRPSRRVPFKYFTKRFMLRMSSSLGSAKLAQGGGHCAVRPTDLSKGERQYPHSVETSTPLHCQVVVRDLPLLLQTAWAKSSPYTCPNLNHGVDVARARADQGLAVLLQPISAYVLTPTLQDHIRRFQIKRILNSAMAVSTARIGPVPWKSSMCISMVTIVDRRWMKYGNAGQRS